MTWEQIEERKAKWKADSERLVELEDLHAPRVSGPARIYVEIARLSTPEEQKRVLRDSLAERDYLREQLPVEQHAIIDMELAYFKADRDAVRPEMETQRDHVHVIKNALEELKREYQSESNKLAGLENRYHSADSNVGRLESERHSLLAQYPQILERTFAILTH
jgi:hypothetical protein